MKNFEKAKTYIDERFQKDVYFPVFYSLRGKKWLKNMATMKKGIYKRILRSTSLDTYVMHVWNECIEPTAALEDKERQKLVAYVRRQIDLTADEIFCDYANEMKCLHYQRYSRLMTTWMNNFCIEIYRKVRSGEFRTDEELAEYFDNHYILSISKYISYDYKHYTNKKKYSTYSRPVAIIKKLWKQAVLHMGLIDDTKISHEDLDTYFTYFAGDIKYLRLRCESYVRAFSPQRERDRWAEERSIEIDTYAIKQ